MLNSNIIKMKNVVIKKDDDTSSLGFETTAGGACARLRLGVGVAINVLYLGHTLLAQILRPLVFLRISLLPHQLLPPFCAFYSTFAPAFSRTHFCGAAQEYKWSEMKKRERQREEIDSEVRGLLTFNLQPRRKKESLFGTMLRGMGEERA